MTKQKEFHELMREMEELEKEVTQGPWYKDRDFPEIKQSHTRFIEVCDPRNDHSHGMTNCQKNAEFIAQSRNFIPLAIDRIKRLERALYLLEDQFIEWDSNRQRDEFRQIKKELGK